MKTPREILLECHSGMQGKLDELREETIRTLVAPVAMEEARALNLVDLLRSLRWHLAAAGAAWMLVLLLNAEGSPEPAQFKAAQNGPSSAQLLAAVQEHRRELLSWENETATTPEPPDKPLPPRRSELQSTNVVQIV
jgi:hypothetical protein